MPKSKSTVSKLVIFSELLKKNFLYIVLLLTLYWLRYTVELTSTATEVVQVLVSVLLFIIVVKSSFVVIDTAILELEQKFKNQKVSRIIGSSLKFALLLIAALTIINNLGVNITSLLTGLGISGVAIAFAVQNILGDLFSSVSIYLDKPFAIGDTIKVGKHTGTVKKIGIKSTRIKLLKGTELILSNKVLSESEVINIKRMQTRRVEFSLNLSYENSLTKIKKVPEIVTSIIDPIKQANLVRVKLSDLNQNNITYEIVYQIPNRDFKVYAEIRESIYLELLSKLQKAKIKLSHASTTVLINSEDA